MDKKPSSENVEDYIHRFPIEVQEKLQAIRSLILKTVPEVSESISYGMPAYSLNKKPLVYFAAFKNHIGFYATPTGHTAFAEELSSYKQGKGSVQFSHKNPLPYELIEKIVLFRAQENRTYKKK
jgi:uncharacterized protein YdhG (YjbR/CyaY superfamily)